MTLRDLLESLPTDALLPVGFILEELGVEQGGDVGPLGDLTLQQVAEATGRAVSTVRTWCNSGRLPGCYRLNGRDWRVPRAALEALRNGKPEPAADRPSRPADLAAWRSERAAG